MRADEVLALFEHRAEYAPASNTKMDGPLLPYKFASRRAETCGWSLPLA